MAPIQGWDERLAVVLFDVGVDDVGDVVLVVFHFGEEGIVGFLLVVLNLYVRHHVLVVGIDDGHAGGFRLGLFLDNLVVVIGHDDGRLIGHGPDDRGLALRLLVL